MFWIIKVNTNFTIYINDLKVLYEIERELQEKRVRTFNDIFVTAIDKLKFDYLTEIILNKLEEDIHEKVLEAIETKLGNN